MNKQHSGLGGLILWVIGPTPNLISRGKEIWARTNFLKGGRGGFPWGYSKAK